MAIGWYLPINAIYLVGTLVALGAVRMKGELNNDERMEISWVDSSSDKEDGGYVRNLDGF